MYRPALVVYSQVQPQRLHTISADSIRLCDPKWFIDYRLSVNTRTVYTERVNFNNTSFDPDFWSIMKNRRRGPLLAVVSLTSLSFLSLFYKEAVFKLTNLIQFRDHTTSNLWLVNLIPYVDLDNILISRQSVAWKATQVNFSWNILFFCDLCITPHLFFSFLKLNTVTYVR